jgi:beta-lactam-binding protein with PASTA domain
MTIFLTSPEQTTGVAGPVLLAGPALGLGPPTAPTAIAVPDVSGKTEGDAITELQGFGFTTLAVQVPGPGTEGEVYGQQPLAGEVVPRGVLVRVFVISPESLPVDVSARFDQVEGHLQQLVQELTDLSAAVASAETEDAAKTRFDAIMAALGNIASAAPKSSGKPTA